MRLEDVAKFKNPIIMGDIIYNIHIYNGYCIENKEKKCDECRSKNLQFGNKKCRMNGRRK